MASIVLRNIELESIPRSNNVLRNFQSVYTPQTRRSDAPNNSPYLNMDFATRKPQALPTFNAWDNPSSAYNKNRVSAVNRHNNEMKAARLSFDQHSAQLYKELVPMYQEQKKLMKSGNNPEALADLNQKISEKATEAVVARGFSKGVGLNDLRQVAAVQRKSADVNTAIAATAPKAQSSSPKSSNEAPVVASVTVSAPKAAKSAKTSRSSGSEATAFDVEGTAVSANGEISPERIRQASAPKAQAVQQAVATTGAGAVNIKGQRAAIEDVKPAVEQTPVLTGAPVYNIGDQSAMLLPRYSSNPTHLGLSKYRGRISEFPEQLSNFATHVAPTLAPPATVNVGLPMLTGFEDATSYKKEMSTSLDYLGTLSEKGVKVNVSMPHIPELAQDATPEQKTRHQEFTAMRLRLTEQASGLGIDVTTPSAKDPKDTTTLYFQKTIDIVSAKTKSSDSQAPIALSSAEVSLFDRGLKVDAKGYSDKITQFFGIQRPEPAPQFSLGGLSMGGFKQKASELRGPNYVEPVSAQVVKQNAASVPQPGQGHPEPQQEQKQAPVVGGNKAGYLM